MTNLETRLKQLRPSFDTAAWNDVERLADRLVARQRGHRRRLAFAVAFAAALFVVVPALGVLGLFDGLLTTSTTPERLPQPSVPRAPESAFIYGRTLVLPGGKTIELSAPLSAPLRDADVALAAWSPDSGSIVYHSWRENVPELRLVDVAKGDDDLLAEGAQSFAWRSDGAIAYVLGSPRQYRPGQPWTGQVVVRSAAGGTLAQWTTVAGRYEIAGWAGTRLLVESEASLVAHLEAPTGTLIFSSPSKFVNVEDSSVIAISPDGRFFLARVQEGDNLSDEVRVIEVRTGEAVAKLHLRATAARLGLSADQFSNGLTSRGSWLGDQILAVSTFTRSTALVFLRFDGRELTVERVLRLDGSAGLDEEQGAHFASPRFLDPRGELVAVRTTVPRVVDGRDTATSYFLACDLPTRHCLRGRPVVPGQVMTLIEPPPR